MLELDEQFVTDVSEAIYQTLLKRRQTPPGILRFNGEVVATVGVPVHLEAAVLLEHYFCSDNRWRNVPAIVALVQQAVEDIDKEIATLHTNDDSIDDLLTLRSNLQNWLEDGD